ncbi:MAG: hypothetical protein WC383_12395 [Gammaproteobacteria bacterium]
MQARTILETEAPAVRRLTIPMIRWSAIIAGSVAGLASYLLLALFGIAVGLTAIEPQAAEPVGNVPILAGVWSGLSLLIASFIGGYVAARMSGLERRSDGLLHGFVAWATIMLLLTWLTTTAIGNVLGSTFNLLGQGVAGVGQAAAEQGGVTQQLRSLITGTEGGDVAPADLRALQDRLQAGDRNGAVNVLVSRMGFSQDRAVQVVDRAMPLFGPQGGEQIRETAGQVLGTVATASWWLVITMILGLILGIWGGAMGARSLAERTAEDHTAERHVRYY